MKEYSSIFNHALAPITPGPSSSNTCGPVRIGMVCQQLLGETPANIVVEYYSKGAFVTTLYGMRSDQGFINGLLGKEQNTPDFNEAYENAQDAGMDISFVDVVIPLDEMPPIMVRVGGQISKELGMCCSGCCLTPTGERLARERAN